MNEKASPGLRIIASLIDHLLLWAIYLLLLLFLASAADISQLLDHLALTLIFFTFILTLGIPLYSIFITAKLGGTVGKLITGIEVVKSQGDRISLWQAFFRNYIGYLVSGLLFWLGFIWIAIDPDRRGWHDMLADTFVVVKKRGGEIIGVLAPILLLGVNLLLVATTIQQFRSHKSLYQEIASEIVSEIQNVATEDATPSPYPLATTSPLL